MATVVDSPSGDAEDPGKIVHVEESLLLVEPGSIVCRHTESFLMSALPGALVACPLVLCDRGYAQKPRGTRSASTGPRRMCYLKDGEATGSWRPS